MKAQIRNNYIQSGGYGIVRVCENLDNLHVEKNLFKIGDNVIKLKNKRVCIKIDTEGHENEVLQGLRKLLTRNKIFLQIEIFKENFKKTNYFLKKLKFRKINSVTSDRKTDYYYINY